MPTLCEQLCDQILHSDPRGMKSSFMGLTTSTSTIFKAPGSSGPILETPHTAIPLELKQQNSGRELPTFVVSIDLQLTVVRL